MIVLDEQLLGRKIDEAIAKWYQGPVLFVTELRLGTIIKDDVIPQLLRLQRNPTFVTINVSDFWQKVTIDPRFSVVCFPINDAEVPNIPIMLKQLFRAKRFRTKSQRSGRVFRVRLDGVVQFYEYDDEQLREFIL